MKLAALGLAAMGVLCLAANQAFAQRGASRPAAVTVTAGHGIQGAGYIGTLRHYRRAGHYHPGYGRRRAYHGYYGGYGPAIVPQYVPRYPVAVPYYRYARPYAHPYYRPHGGFNYYGPGLSIGIGF